MSKFASAVRRFVRDEEGASMAEYALLVAVIALVAIAGARTLGTSINNRLSGAATTITNGQ
jgi:pilus assembly protein Flp/PilA